MSNTAANHCKNLENVTKEELVNALHQSLMQFRAIARYESLSLVDNRPTEQLLTEIMTRAGHIGFTPALAEESVTPGVAPSNG